CDRHVRVAIGSADLLARGQIFECLETAFCCNPEGKAMTCAAAVQSEDKAGSLRRAAVVGRIQAEAAPIADECRASDLFVGEAWSPHERPVAEHPQVLAAAPSFDHGCEPPPAVSVRACWRP